MAYASAVKGTFSLPAKYGWSGRLGVCSTHVSMRHSQVSMQEQSVHNHNLGLVSGVVSIRTVLGRSSKQVWQEAAAPTAAPQQDVQ